MPFRGDTGRDDFNLALAFQSQCTAAAFLVIANPCHSTVQDSAHQLIPPFIGLLKKCFEPGSNFSRAKAGNCTSDWQFSFDYLNLL
jgi:hypothetical protein